MKKNILIPYTKDKDGKPNGFIDPKSVIAIGVGPSGYYIILNSNIRIDLIGFGDIEKLAEQINKNR